nr:efflux RND transporter periplasmic adaptor subunit [Deltaproteobacteria bacterium]
MRHSILLVSLLGCGHGHDHDDKGGHSKAELPGQSVTLWTERTELFMEYQPLIVGKETRFAAHVTEMPTFKAVTAGNATITLTMAGTGPLEGAVKEPSNPGIFRPTITPTKAGKCELKMALTGPQLT